MGTDKGDCGIADAQSDSGGQPLWLKRTHTLALRTAIEEARDAFTAWAMAEREDKGELPAPKTYSGQFVQRIPKTLHMRLAKRAASEGVSLNQLAATLLAQGLGPK